MNKYFLYFSSLNLNDALKQPFLVTFFDLYEL